MCHLSVQWPINSPVTGLHIFLSAARRSLHFFREGPSVKRFDCLIHSVAAQYLEYFLVSHYLILSLPIHGIAGLGLRNKLFNLFPAKASTSSLPHCGQGPRGAFSCLCFTGYKLHINIHRFALT
jgi:hypothetical protein